MSRNNKNNVNTDFSGKNLRTKMLTMHEIREEEVRLYMGNFSRSKNMTIYAFYIMLCYIVFVCRWPHDLCARLRIDSPGSNPGQ